jgi:hypothetical protein
MRCIARPAAPGTDGEFAGQMRIRPGGEGGDLLVPDVDPFDLSLSANGIGEAVEAVTDDPVDAFNSRRSKRFGELICNSSCHVSSPVRGLDIRCDASPRHVCRNGA